MIPMTEASRGSTDPSLLERAKKGEDRAWIRLVDLYGPLVWFWCSRTGIPESDRRDLVQDIFLGVFRGLKTFECHRPDTSFRGWLLRITLNKCRDHFRKRKGFANVSLDQIKLEPAEEASLSGLEEAERNSRSGDDPLNRILNFLKGDFSQNVWQAFWKTAVDNQTAAQAAADLQMTPQAVRTARSRVLKKLREEFGDLLDVRAMP